MNYRLIEKPAFSVIGNGIRVTTRNDEYLQTIPAFWNQSISNGFYERLSHLKQGSSLLQRLAHIIHGDVVLEEVTLGVCTDYSANQEDFTYLIAVESETGIAPAGMIEHVVPASTWAVFDAVGPLPDTIQAVWASIFSDFFVNEPFTHGNGPDLELYPDGDDSRTKYHCEVWVPVVRK